MILLNSLLFLLLYSTDEIKINDDFVTDDIEKIQYPTDFNKYPSLETENLITIMDISPNNPCVEFWINSDYNCAVEDVVIINEQGPLHDSWWKYLDDIYIADAEKINECLKKKHTISLEKFILTLQTLHETINIDIASKYYTLKKNKTWSKDNIDHMMISELFKIIKINILKKTNKLRFNMDKMNITIGNHFRMAFKVLTMHGKFNLISYELKRPDKNGVPFIIKPNKLITEENSLKELLNKYPTPIVHQITTSTDSKDKTPLYLIKITYIPPKQKYKKIHIFHFKKIILYIIVIILLSIYIGWIIYIQDFNPIITVQRKIKKIN